MTVDFICEQNFHRFNFFIVEARINCVTFLLDRFMKCLSHVNFTFHLNFRQMLFIVFHELLQKKYDV